MNPVQFFSEIEHMEEIVSGIYLEDKISKNIFNYLRSVSLLRKLAEIEVTPAEYSVAKSLLKGFQTQALADLTDGRLKPFREIQARSRNVDITSDPASTAYEQVQFRNRQFIFHIHLSKNHNRAPDDFGATPRGKVKFFRYEPQDDGNGLLATALLWAHYQQSGLRLEGIGERDGFYSFTGEYLRSLVQQFQSDLIIRIAA